MMGAKAPVYNIPNMQATTPEGMSDKQFVIATVAGIILFFAVTVGLPCWIMSNDRAAENALREAAPFHVGDIVYSRIGKFRGTVIGVTCNKECGYLVRFNVFSMEPQWVEEYELKPMAKR